jgi:predicted DCC family thiol-disulfide oxidoreductase YuxK
MHGASNVMIYDGDCPFCSNFVRLVRLRTAIGTVRLVNAREGGPDIKNAIAQGFDLNEGMLLVIDQQYYYGADCINRLALLSTRSGAFNKIVAVVFRSTFASKLLYPVLRSGRNMTLCLLGRQKMNL